MSVPPDDALPRCWPVDRLVAGFFLAAAAATAVNFPRVEHAARFLAIDAAVLATLGAVWFVTPRVTPRTAAVLRLLHGCVATPLIFTQTGYFVKGVRGVEYAAQLERLDRLLFLGINPLEALERIATPWLTELMQWSYSLYLVLPPAVVLLLAAKARPREVSRACFSLLGVMYLSYVGYVLVPASGPNLHNNLGPLKAAAPAYPYALNPGLYTFKTDLPGVWLAREQREWMFDVEATKQDCFPSGHTAVAIVCWALARRVDRRIGRWFLVAGTAVTLSTVYLRYHYVVDVICGALLAWIAVGPFARLHDRWARTEPA